MSTPTRTPDLAAALQYVQANPQDKRAWRQWDVVVTAIKAAVRLQRLRDHMGELVSLSFLRVRTTDGHFVGDSEGEARGYIRRIVRTAYIDEVRKRVRRERHLMQQSPHDDRDPFATIAAPESEPLHAADDAPAKLAEFIDRLHGRIDAYLDEQRKLTPESRQLRWNEAMTAILSVVGGKSTQEIIDELGVAKATAACIYKWTERGRVTVQEVLKAWAAEGDEADEEAIEALTASFNKRRADAGVARESRRKPAKKQTKPRSANRPVSLNKRYASVQHEGRRGPRARRPRREVPSV